MSFNLYPRSLFGRMVAASDIEDALHAQVDTWVDPYLAEVERQHGITVGTIARPRAFVVAGEENRNPEDQLPAITIESPGTADLPAADGEGRYMVRFECDLGIHVAASTGAIRLAKLYGLALRALVLQQPPTGVLMGIDWTAERYPPVTLQGDRSIARAQVRLECHAADVADRYAGPTDPDYIDPGEGPSPEWPTAQTHDEDIVKVPTEGDL